VWKERDQAALAERDGSGLAAGTQFRRSDHLVQMFYIAVKNTGK
jgi:hypothetical protein